VIAGLLSSLIIDIGSAMVV